MPTATPTPTPTRTEPAPAVTSLHVVRAGGRSVVHELRGGAPLGLRELGGPEDGWARVAVVQTAATLVAGDDVRLLVRVGDGARLALGDISATLAHPGALARHRIDVRLGAGARLVLTEQPLIVAAGARLRREVRLDLGAGAVVLHRDTLVLGRHGEEPGAARLRLRVVREDLPVLDETLDTGDLGVLRSAAVLGSARAIGSLGLYGRAAPGELPSDAFRLGPSDTLLRRPAAGTRELGGLDAVQAAWAAAV